MDLTPEPHEEDQERGDDQLVGKPVPYTVADVEAAVRVLHANRYDGEEDIDEDARIEIVALVLSTVAPKIQEAAYQAGREDAARDIEAMAARRAQAASALFGANDPGVEDLAWAARIARGADVREALR